MCNQRNLSIARWFYIDLNRLRAKMASFWEAFSGKRFVYCALNIVYTIQYVSLLPLYSTSLAYYLYYIIYHSSNNI